MTRALILAALGLAGWLGVATAQPALKSTPALDALERDTANHRQALFANLFGFVQRFDRSNVSDLREMSDRLDWLQTRALMQSDIRYGYAYAAYLWKTGHPKVRDSAIAMLIMTEARMRVDAARCADQTAPGTNVAKYQFFVRPLVEYLPNARVEEKQTALNIYKRQRLERMLERPRFEWICAGGADSLARFFEKYPELAAQPAGQPMPQELRDKYKDVMRIEGNTIVLTDPNIRPEFVPDEEWNRRAAEIYAAYSKTVTEVLGK